MYTPQFAVFWAQYKRPLLALLLVLGVIILGIILGLETRIIAVIATLVGLLTSAFAGVTGLIALIPWLGPLLVKALSLPVIWLMNGAGYFTAIVLTKRGHGKSVMDSRVLTIVLLIGVIIGYILGKLI